MLSTSAPEPSVEWMEVRSRKDRQILKKQQKKPQATTTKSAETSQQTNKNVKSQASQQVVDNREELDFRFDEEIVHSGSKANDGGFSSSEEDYDESDSSSSDELEDEIDEVALQKLVIITQTPPVNRKQASTTVSNDRTGYHVPRSKITSELARAINDGLYYYERDLKRFEQEKQDVKQVDLVSYDEFKKLKDGDQDMPSDKKKTSSQKAGKPVTDHSAINKPTNPYQQHQQSQIAFQPQSLPTDMITPSFKQLMLHVNSIKSTTPTLNIVAPPVGNIINQRKQQRLRNSETVVSSNVDEAVKSIKKRENSIGPFIHADLVRISPLSN